MDGEFEPPTNELELCKTALCCKEHELTALRSNLQTQQVGMQTLSKSVERLERTLSAGMDRLVRSVNRLGGARKRDRSPMNSDFPETGKRRRMDNYAPQQVHTGLRGI
jgi:DNA anti-recombination protein RmuC